VFCWVLQTAETIVQGLNLPNLTPRLEKMFWSKMQFNNQSTITVDSPRQQKPMFSGEHNGPGHFITSFTLGNCQVPPPSKTTF
jgi:hypothetical protein